MAEQKKLFILPAMGSAMVRIAWEGGGEVPHELSGLYTSHATAEQAIASWTYHQVARKLQEKSEYKPEAKGDKRKPSPQE